MLVPVMEAAAEDTEDDEDARFSSDALQGLSDAIRQAAHSSPLDLGLVPRVRPGAAQGAAGCPRQSLRQDPAACHAGLLQDGRTCHPGDGQVSPKRGPAMALRAAVAAKREQAARETRSLLLPGLLHEGEAAGGVERPNLLFAGLEQILDDKPFLDTPSLSQAETECSGDEWWHRGREAASSSEVESSDCGPSDDAWGT